MSATTINMHDWINEFRELVPSHIHPTLRWRCQDLISEMHAPVEAGDNGELPQLINIVREIIADELEWEEDKRLSTNDPKYVPRCMRAQP